MQKKEKKSRFEQNLERATVTESEERSRRIAVAAAIAGVLVASFFLILLIIQFVQIGIRTSRIHELDRQKEALEQMIEENSKDLDFYRTEDGYRYLALQQRWREKG